MNRSASADAARRAVQIGLVSPLPPQVGGVARVAGWLLLNQDQIGCEYDTFDLTRRSAEEIGGRVRLSSFPYQVLLFGRFVGWLQRAPHIVHFAVSDSIPGLARDVVFIVTARAFGRRVIAHVHSLHYGTARGARIFHVPVLRLIARLSSQCVTLGPTAARELQRLGVGCRWIFNPVPVIVEAAPRPQENSHPLRLLYVGAYGARKGTADLIEAVARARAAGVDGALCIVGRAMYRGEQEKLARLAAERSVGDAVTFAGEVSSDGVAAFYAGADVICMPSWQEGLPMALLEGMASGLPALATTVGCIPDIVEPGRSGILVRRGAVDEIASAIGAFAADPDGRRRMGEAARTRVLAVADPEKIALEWRTVYDCVAARVTS